MNSYNVELHGNYSLSVAVTASSQEEAVQIASNQIHLDAGDLHFDVQEVNVYQEETYVSLAQHYSQPRQQQNYRPYTSLKAFISNNNTRYTPYSR